MKPTTGASNRIYWTGVALWVVLQFLCSVSLQAQTGGTDPKSEAITPKELKVAAYNSLWRLKRAIERDGFYGARVALNVWRSNAIDAGIFKQAEYDDYKKQIYEKSLDNSLKCFEYSIENQNIVDAGRCLHTWKIHSEELGKFEPARYEKMLQRLEEADANHRNIQD